MIVKVINAFYSGPTLFTIGRVLDIRDEMAALWVAQGFCEYQHSAVEVAILPPYETAVSRKPTTRKRRK